MVGLLVGVWRAALYRPGWVQPIPWFLSEFHNNISVFFLHGSVGGNISGIEVWWSFFWKWISKETNRENVGDW